MYKKKCMEYLRMMTSWLSMEEMAVILLCSPEIKTKNFTK